MKVHICLIGGFLEAGKTTYIQNLLKNQRFRDGKKTVLICCEQGMRDYDSKILTAANTSIIYIENRKDINSSLFYSIQKKYSPDRIIIEYNGTWEIGEFLKIKFPTEYIINRIICIINTETFRVYVNNMSFIMSEQLGNSDAILLNSNDAISHGVNKNVLNTLKSINGKAEIKSMEKALQGLEIENLFNGFNVKGTYKELNLLLILICFMSAYLSVIYLKSEGFNDILKGLHILCTIFVSILIQALPFVLIGVFVSSLFQFFINDQKLVYLFTKYEGLGYPLAILLGTCFPVCDCAMAPITTRLMKKGVPVKYVITFLLVSPVVNPIVIISTMYAYPDDYRVILLRLVSGIIISLAAGILIGLSGITRGDTLKETVVENICANGLVGSYSSRSFWGRLQIMASHAGAEFFKISKYVMAGALITSLIQIFVPRSSLEVMAEKPIFSIMVMLFAALMMSVCSTSNAFIAKGFSYGFPLYSVIFYMVMGPMLDLKNIFMLSSGFRIKFLSELIMILAVTGIFVFSIIAFII